MYDSESGAYSWHSACVRVEVKEAQFYNPTVSRAACCSCVAGYRVGNIGQCELPTCTDTDGDGTDFVCGAGSMFNMANANQPFSFDACCSCTAGYVPGTPKSTRQHIPTKGS